jgi:hypothetical protein
VIERELCALETAVRAMCWQITFQAVTRHK